MIHMQLSDPQRQELERVSRQAIGRVALRAQMVLQSDRGSTVPQIAQIHACGQDVVRTWLHRSAQHGVAGLEDEPRELPTAQGPSGWADRGRPGQSVATLLGPCPDVLDGLPADCLSFRTIPSGPLLLQHSTLAPPDRLALGTSPTGTCSQARPSSRSQTGGAGRGPAGGSAGTGSSALSGRVGAASPAADPCDVDERAAQARAHAWHQPSPRVFWRVGCGEWSLVLCRS